MGPRRRGAAVLVAVATGGRWWVAHSSGQRLPGDEISGGVGDPDSATALLSQAPAAWAEGDAATAVANYQRVLDRNPKDAEALTYSGWLLFIGSADAAGERARRRRVGRAPRARRRRRRRPQLRRPALLPGRHRGERR